jgi:hypothetical protein
MSFLALEIFPATASAIAKNPAKVSQNDSVHDFVSPKDRTPSALRSFRSFSRRWRPFGNQIKQLCVTGLGEALRRDFRIRLWRLNAQPIREPVHEVEQTAHSGGVMQGTMSPSHGMAVVATVEAEDIRANEFALAGAKRRITAQQTLRDIRAGGRAIVGNA